MLVTLTAREHSERITIVAAVRESENVHLLRQSGANSVIVSAETAGRLAAAPRRHRAGCRAWDKLHRVDAAAVDALKPGDRLLYVRKVGSPDGD